MVVQTIKFIQDPPYVVDFTQYNKKNVQEEGDLSTYAKVHQVALASLKFTKLCFASMGTAGYSTLSHAGVSFKYIVLGYYGKFKPPSDIQLVAFKVVFWIAGMAWCFITTSFRLIYNKTNQPLENNELGPHESLLSQYADPEIDVSHITTNELKIDVSIVPAEVAVDELLPMYDAINFDQPLNPGYMAPLSRTEANTTYTKEDLRTSLQKFIDHVKGRVAFLGTPPAYDTPRLMAFYEQIESGVRFSIYKVNKELQEFRQSRGEDPAAYVGADREKYKNLLEERARVVINLAIAGKHCGARYMGESMEIYSSLTGEIDVSKGSLQETLTELLAAKRKEIATKQIYAHFGSNTHGYGKYMSSLGSILALPGTANIIEHLSSGLDKSRFLKEFFKDYTVDYILDSIQEKVKKSQLFREKITSWLQNQVNNWNREKTEKELEDLLGKIDPILAQQQISEDSPLYESFLTLRNLLAHLSEKNSPLPPGDQEPRDFLSELFALPEAKNWLIANYPDLRKRATLKQRLVALGAENQLGKPLILKILEGPLRLEDFSERLLLLEKTSKICALAHIPPDSQDTITRIVEGKLETRKALLDYLDLKRKHLFLECLNLETIHEQGLSPELLEWICVSQKILAPQQQR